MSFFHFNWKVPFYDKSDEIHVLSCLNFWEKGHPQFKTGPIIYPFVSYKISKKQRHIVNASWRWSFNQCYIPKYWAFISLENYFMTMQEHDMLWSFCETYLKINKNFTSYSFMEWKNSKNNLQMVQA